MLVVADQTPVQYQDPVGLLDPPLLWLRDEPCLPRSAFDDPDVDTQAGSMRDDLVLEALVDHNAHVTVSTTHESEGREGGERQDRR